MNGRWHAEVAVIGSGPGGAISAALLAEAGREVLLLEEGAALPLSACPPFSAAEMESKYRCGGMTTALGRPKIAYVEGCVAGGGSEINSALYHRTPPEILAQWRDAYRVEGLGEEEMAPHFAQVEQELSVATMPGEWPKASLRLRQGANALGWKSLEVPRWVRYRSGGPAQGERQTMSVTYLPRAQRAGARLLAETRAAHLAPLAGGWAIEVRRPGGRREIIRTPTVFLCAGAIQTPALLRRSGIRRNIGRTLQVHPTVKVVARFPEVVNSAGMGVPVHQVKEFAPRISFGCSISSPPFLALGLLEAPELLPTLSRDWPRMAVYYAMITPRGRGFVLPLPGVREPLVGYRLAGEDLRNLGEALDRLCQLLFAAGADLLCPALTGWPPLRSDAARQTLPASLPASRAQLMTIHLMGSCPMGEDRARCAADSYGRVHGLRGLYLNDASLLCSACGVNPQGSILALARRNVLHFLAAT